MGQHSLPYRFKLSSTTFFSRLRAHALLASTLVVFLAAIVFCFVWFVYPAPPKTIVMSAGPRDSSFLPAAEAYKAVLARNGITLKILLSDGSVQNLHRLLDKNEHADLALVQGGVAQGMNTSSLVSLGSVFYAPLVVFYRGAEITRLSQLAGKRIAIGREGSGTRVLALNLLKANGIVEGADTTMLPVDGEQAAQLLTDGKADAALFNGDSATRAMMIRLLRVPGISAMDFVEARAYTRLFPYLNEIDLPPGVLDLGQVLPANTIHLISPMVEMVARPSLHPAIADLLIEAAQEVNGSAGLLQAAGEFPSPIAHEFRISEDAARYYKTGKSFLYRTLPFWLASLVDRLLVLVVPLAALFIPASKMLPAIYTWHIRSRVYRWYGLLLAIERQAITQTTATEREKLVRALDDIETSVNQLKMPLAYADAFYVLREHIGFVRSRLKDDAVKSQDQVRAIAT